VQQNLHRAPASFIHQQLLQQQQQQNDEANTVNRLSLTNSRQLD